MTFNLQKLNFFSSENFKNKFFLRTWNNANEIFPTVDRGKKSNFCLELNLLVDRCSTWTWTNLWIRVLDLRVRLQSDHRLRLIHELCEKELFGPFSRLRIKKVHGFCRAHKRPTIMTAITNAGRQGVLMTTNKARSLCAYSCFRNWRLIF